MAISALLGFVIQLFIVDSFGYQALFLIMAGLMAISIFILYYFNEVNQWKIQHNFKLIDAKIDITDE